MADNKDRWKALDAVLVEQWLDRVSQITEEPVTNNRPGVFQLLNGFLFTGLSVENEDIVKGWVWMTIRWAIPIGFSVWAVGGLAWEDEKGRVHGWEGFAFADEVDDKIDEAIDPIKKDVSAINDKLLDTNRKLDVLLRNQTREKIRTLVKQRCELPTDTRYYVRQSITDDINEAVTQYQELTGRTYEPKCEEV